MLVATGIFMFNMQEFFGGDAITYDFFGDAQMRAWQGDSLYKVIADRFMNGQASAWGMVNVIALIYTVIGRNTLAIQFVNSVIGAATAVLVFYCAQHVYQKHARGANSCYLRRVFPVASSLVRAGLEGCADSFLASRILASLRLNEKLSVKYAAILIVALFSILSLRFYVFYMITVAIAGGFIIGFQKFTPTNFARQFVVILLVGVSLTYLGVTRYASQQFDSFGTFGNTAKKPR